MAFVMTTHEVPNLYDTLKFPINRINRECMCTVRYTPQIDKQEIYLIQVSKTNMKMRIADDTRRRPGQEHILAVSSSSPPSPPLSASSLSPPSSLPLPPPFHIILKTIYMQLQNGNLLPAVHDAESPVHNALHCIAWVERMRLRTLNQGEGEKKRKNKPHSFSTPRFPLTGIDTVLSKLYLISFPRVSQVRVNQVMSSQDRVESSRVEYSILNRQYRRTESPRLRRAGWAMGELIGSSEEEGKRAKSALGGTGTGLSVEKWN